MDIGSSIQKYLSAVLSKRPVQAVCLWGEPGIGKTHLAKSILQQTPCRSFSVQATVPQVALTKVLPQPHNLSPEISRNWECVAQGQALEPKKFAQALSAVLVGLAPVVLHLENLHAADEGQRVWINELRLALPKLRGVGLLLTSRTALPQAQNYALGRLSPQESRELLEANLDAGLPKGLPQEGLEWIYQRALGNPLVNLEYLKYLSRQGFFWSDGVHWHWRLPPSDFIPPTLEALVYGWVRRYAQGESPRQALESRALLPDLVPDGVWAEVAELGLEVLQQAKLDLQRMGMLKGEQLFHPLLSGIIQKQMSQSQRKKYSARALGALEGVGLEPSATLIAEASLGQPKTLQIYQRLAEQAKTQQDWAKAGHWLALALEQSEGQERTKLALEAAQFLRHSDLARATQLAQMAAFTQPHDPQAVYLCAELWVAQGETGQAETILGLLSDTQRHSQRWWETLIRLHYTTHANHAEVLRLWSLKPEFQAKAHPEIVLYVSSVIGQRGQFEEAFALSGPLLQQPDLEPFVRARVLELQAVLNFLKGDFINSEILNAQAIVLARSLNRPVYLAKLLRKYAIDAESLGNFGQAALRYREALELYQHHGPGLDFAYTQSSLGKLLVDLGEFEEAESLLLQAQKVLEASEHQLYRCDCQNGLALLYLEWQPSYGGTLALKHARNSLEYALEIKNQQMTQAGLINLAQAEAQYGNPDKALELAQLAIQEQHSGPSAVRKAWGQSALAWALEAVGKPSEALKVWAEVVAQLEEHQMHKMAHRYGLELARLESDLNLARQHHGWFVEQGLLGGAKIALRYFPGLQAPIAQPPAVLRLNLLGPAQLEKNAEPVAYRGRKRLEFLVYLLETRIAGRTEASLLELMDTLYPGVGESEAKAVIKQLVYLLRIQLGSEAVLSTSGGYALGAIESDVELFLKTGGVELWRGPYLAGLDGYLPGVREALLRALQRTIIELLPNNPAQAGRLGQIWLEMEPYENSALRLCVQAHLNAGQAKTAERIYHQSRERLQEVGERLPPSSQAFLVGV